MKKCWHYAMLFLFVSCSNNNGSETGILRDGAWQLESYTSESGLLTDVTDTSPYQMKFEKQSGLIRSYINCANQTSGRFELFDGYIKIQLGTDDFIGDCADDNSNTLEEQSDAVLQLLGLNQSDSVELGLIITDSELRLETNGGQVLLFRHVDKFHEVSGGDVLDLLTQNDWSTIFFTDRGQTALNIPLEAEWKIKFSTSSSTGRPILTKFIGPCTFTKMSYTIDDNKLVKQGFETTDGPRCTEIPSVTVGVEIGRKAFTVLVDSNEFYVKQENPDELTLRFYSENGESFTLVPEN